MKWAFTASQKQCELLILAWEGSRFADSSKKRDKLREKWQKSTSYWLPYLTILRNMTKETFRHDVAMSFCNLARMQPFYDGNKRSALFLCNVAMFKKDLGIFTIPIDKYATFNDNLRDFYVNKSQYLKDFIACEFIMTVHEMMVISDTWQ